MSQVDTGRRGWEMMSSLSSQGSSGWSICKPSGIHLWVSISSFPHQTLAGVPFNLILFPNGAIYLRTELVCSKLCWHPLWYHVHCWSCWLWESRLREFWELDKPGMHKREMGIRFQLYFKHHILWVYSTVRLDINKHDYDKIIIDY